MKKKALSLLLSLVMACSCLPMFSVAVSASTEYEYTEPTIVVESKYTSAGAEVEVDVNIENNPGVAGATLRFSYDSDLTLIKAVNGEAFSDLTFTVPGKFTNPSDFLWDSLKGQTEGDGTILTLTFKVSEDVEADDVLDVDVSYYPGDIYNEDMDSLSLQMVNGSITVIDYIPGDVNGDGVVQGKDVTLIRRHIVGGYEQKINEAAADVNEDDRINGKDVTLLRRYIVGDPIELKPSKPKCNHSMKSTPYKAATCTVDGNIAYWHCSVCDKYFSDSEGTKEVAFENTVIVKTGHNIVIDPAVAPTYTSTGLTEGSHCTNAGCNVSVPQEIIPVLRGYSIEYNIANGDTYLAQLGISNPNSTSYNPDQDTFVLKDLTAPAGYKFLGWYDGAGDNAIQIKEITKGSSGNKQLYAHWSKTEYIIYFASDMVAVNNIRYTTDREVKLPSPKLDKYTFVGWSDKEGNLYDTIPVGTTGDINLYANWASNRNRAVAVDELKEPIILEDSNNGLMLFTYEIGEIRNVPLFTTMNLNCVNGIITEHSKTKEKAISNEQAKTVAQTISNATTNSASWTLSKDWTNTTEVSESYLDQTGQEKTQAEQLAKSQSSTYNIGASFGGSNTTVDTSAGSYKLSGNQSHSNTNTTETGQNFELSVDAKYSHEKSVGVDLGLPIEGIDLGVKAGSKSTFEIGAGVDYSNYVKNTSSSTDSWSNGFEIANEQSHSTTDTKTWNTSQGFSSSNSVSMSNSVSNTVSKLISQQYGYGKSYSEGGSNSEAQELASTDSKSDEFSTTVTYYTSDIESTTTSFTSTGNTIGDYRLVMAGKIHVFAVVGYDVAEKSYFVYTYNVLDDTTEEYLDYSFDGSFNDYETSVIPFEVPGFVNDYVNNRVAITAGLRVDPDAGMIDKYTAPEEGSATIVSVPSYVSVDNNDGTFKAVKITDISSDLFRNNTEIVGVILGHNIKKIPDNAFEGCTSLKYVICQGVTEIGDNAFKGCASLKKFSVTDSLKSLGNNAFEGVPQVTAVASNAEIALAVASSGAENIVLDISKVPQEQADKLNVSVGAINSFELLGKDKEYKDLSLKCDAKTTIVNGIKITEGRGIPLELSSENVTLNRVNINSSGYALLLKAKTTNIKLNGNNNLETENGNTLVCRNINLSPLSVNVVGKMNVSGKVLICGNIQGTEYLTCDSIVSLSEEDYSQYEKGVFSIIFDANGGEVSKKSMNVYFGAKIGELPTPTRNGFSFDGWFTKDGTKVTADTVFATTGDVTLRAHWISGWVKVSEMPSGSGVMAEKWSYDLTSYTTSNSSTMSGWSCYDSTWAWGSYGAWSGWSQSAAYASDSRQVETKTVTDRAGYTNYKYWIYRTSDGWGYGTQNYYTGSAHGSCTVYDEININYSLPVHNSSLGTYGPYNSGKFSHSGDSYWFSGGSSWVPAVTHTEYRYRDRSKVYTYYFKKTDSLESTSDPTGQSNVSNVVKWVKYRVK